jgi:hypothetical protein
MLICHQLVTAAGRRTQVVTLGGRRAEAKVLLQPAGFVYHDDLFGCCDKPRHDGSSLPARQYPIHAVMAWRKPQRPFQVQDSFFRSLRMATPTSYCRDASGLLPSQRERHKWPRQTGDTLGGGVRSTVPAGPDVRCGHNASRQVSNRTIRDANNWAAFLDRVACLRLPVAAHSLRLPGV